MRTGVLCLAVAAALTRPARLGAPVAVVWWLLGLVAVIAHARNDLYDAALSSPDAGPVIPVLDGSSTFLPALLVALAAVPRGRAQQLRAGLGTAVVGVPPLALGWSLFHAPAGSWPRRSDRCGRRPPSASRRSRVALPLTVPLNSRAAPTG